MSEKVKVVIADDQRFARMYADMYIATSPRYEITASLPSADDALDYLKGHSADLVIMDVVMEHGADGFTAAERIKKEYPETKVILATSMADAGWMDRAKDAGIESFWYKEYSKLSLTEIMDRTMDGESVYLDDVPKVYLGSLPVSSLTGRQKLLLTYLIDGLTNKEIAEKMYISANTVKSYLDNIMETSGIHSRTELAVRASRLGLSVDKKSEI